MFDWLASCFLACSSSLPDSWPDFLIACLLLNYWLSVYTTATTILSATGDRRLFHGQQRQPGGGGGGRNGGSQRHRVPRPLQVQSIASPGRYQHDGLRANVEEQDGGGVCQVSNAVRRN